MTVNVILRHCLRGRGRDAIEVGFTDCRIRRGDRTIKVWPTEMRMISVLLSAYSAKTLLSMNDLIDAIYAEDDDGGPLEGDKAIWIRITRLRNKLAPLGVRINNSHGLGYYISVVPMTKEYENG